MTGDDGSPQHANRTVAETAQETHSATVAARVLLFAAATVLLSVAMLPPSSRRIVAACAIVGVFFGWAHVEAASNGLSASANTHNLL